ncbi:hypothetical protein CYMTET_13911 [Cymbomonas tetramitiformis]|uniref:Uncharacterized protein n=1 Tax=Cymbomonas tetramitiformis TaxID=36881 RepID=A0AAE0GIJ5_9CHLO|nr:hypothetical protein CYMTET_13911 [Cymbomonas tetramitiformis]
MTSSRFSNGCVNATPTRRARAGGHRHGVRTPVRILTARISWSRPAMAPSVSKKVAFHRDTGATVPYCQNQVCAKGKARHWHRDCPNGGRTGLSAYAFAEEAENSVLAAKFQHAIDHDDAEEFDALCMLAGGKPDIFADLSACSFCEEDGEALVSAVTEFSELARTAGASTFSVNTFTANMPVVSGPATHSPPASVESDEEWTGPPNPFCPPVTRTFADFIESTGIALGAPDEPPVSMNMLSAIEAPESVMSYEPEACATSDDGDEDASVALPRPRYGWGGAFPAWEVPTAATSPPAPFRGVLGDAVGGAVPDAIPSRRQARYRELRQGFRFYGFLPLPPELVDPDPPIPSSPPYSPPPYSSEDEAPGSGDSATEIGDSLISSTHYHRPRRPATTAPSRCSELAGQFLWKD